MDLPQETDDFIRESIDYSLGLPVSTTTLELKLRSSEETERQLRDQYLYLKSKLNEKDDVIERLSCLLLCLKEIMINLGQIMEIFDK
ncbi:hypothetical protein HanLR1_Chr00c1047g0788601 [Helianthus annuus]|nr:hypothetical protein HanLR1_Chr00c1047g0788601 [Helianthus annuus]